MLEKFGKKVVEHLPEILTIGACVGVIAGDILLVKGAKKETQDGKKTHYIPGAIASGIGVACIIASNRVSNTQKVTLAGAIAALAAQNKSQREKIETKFGADELREMDNVTPTEIGLTYYLPQLDCHLSCQMISISQKNVLKKPRLRLTNSFIPVDKYH